MMLAKKTLLINQMSVTTFYFIKKCFQVYAISRGACEQLKGSVILKCKVNFGGLHRQNLAEGEN